MNSVGLAMAEAHMAKVYNRPGFPVIDHETYGFCSDGDLMEGASHEAASLAGHLGLGKLTWFFDDNHITIEGEARLACTDDVPERFSAYGWHVQNLGEAANDTDTIAAAITIAKKEKTRPSLIIVRSHIGFGAPNRQDTKEAHGEPLGESEVRLAKVSYSWPEEEKFLVPAEAIEHMGKQALRGERDESAWKEVFTRYRKEHPDAAESLEAAVSQILPEGWDSAIPTFGHEGGPVATRVASGKIISAIADRVPWLIGGSADLSPSTKTLIKPPGYFSRDGYGNRNIAWGVREHAMCGCSSGLALHGGLRPFVSTFFVFTDYARPAIRLASLMKLPVIYVMTHDSIGLGEDGPTHQPVEHLASFRAMPGICVIRPADANETAYAWRAAMTRLNGPTLLVLTRQGLPVINRSALAGAEGVTKGAYVLSREKAPAPDLILIASGSEVQLVLGAQQELEQQGIAVRVVSMPSWELFREQPEDYRDSVLPPSAGARISVEAGSSLGWCEWTGPAGAHIGIDNFGASAPASRIFEETGFTVENIVSESKRLVLKKTGG
jgi:transketolase